MLPDQEKFHASGLAAQVDHIRNTIKRFDEATLAAAYSIRDAEMRLVPLLRTRLASSLC